MVLIKQFVCLLLSLSVSPSPSLLALALGEAFASLLSLAALFLLYFYYFLPLDHIPAKSGSQIASAAHSYCKQFIRNFSSDCFWFGFILNSFFVNSVSAK